MCTKMVLKNPLSRVIVDEQHKPTPALLRILTANTINHDGTLHSIVTQTQQAWLRPADKERWETNTVLPFTSDNLEQSLEDLFLIHPIKATNHHYNYALLLGGTINDVRNRLAYLIELWNSGVQFDSIIVLAGERPLNTIFETADLLLNNHSTTLSFKQNWQYTGPLARTETEMIHMVFDQADTPTEWNNIPIIFVDTPIQKTEDGSLRRPNTLDTIKEWMSVYHPHSGSIIAISNQPFIGYQDAVLRNALPKGFTTETIGCANLDNEATAIVLDSLARWIYFEYQMSLSKAL